MANLMEIRSAFDKYLSDNWRHTEIYWDNVSNELPQGKTWIYPTIVIDNSENTVLGRMRTRHNGAYLIRVYCPLDIGPGKIYEISTYLLNILQNKNIEDNILTYAGSMRRIGDNGNGWYQANITLPFTADEIL